MTLREKSILAGLYLSKFDTKGLSALGFSSFKEAYNALGFAIGTKPASLKNYRDELDPYFPNERQGWHKRQLRDHCRAILEQFRDADLESLKHMICNFCGDDFRDMNFQDASETTTNIDAFAQRIMTGRAAENYFTKHYQADPVFYDTEIEDVTHSGCGYDFKLWTSSNRFFAVEVKGIRELRGSIAMTDKEFHAAKALKNSYFLYVVKNFVDTPTPTTVRNPAESNMDFTRTERLVIQVSWRSSI
ncbi:hypothetical protein PDESU_06009 [Pontiella desulfatans]|uniref:Protein NO VEIN C-terminal domain-containing protein n=1 Tax=Pontiella desulfatans TaxID=2750659 RepID=A0A6C2UC08_PONDE|nr:DUF3883 domain-containing protein [Pontiella desulfatans]VGO17413.1 hypothetical protein PDESU_06009 [Pontiella desulfatans]